MKILPVSFGSKAEYKTTNYDSYFLYQKKKSKQNTEHIITVYKIATALTAASAVTIALFNIGKRKRFPDSIADIADKNLGLNKIYNQEKAIETIKSKFIYPIKAVAMGDNYMAKSKYFKSGLVITGENEQLLSQISSALSEHMRVLDVEPLFISSKISRVKDGKTYEKKLKKNEIAKMLYKLLEKAKENYNRTGKYTLINLGNLDNATFLKIVKSKKSKVDELLAGITNTKTPGVVWTGWTKNKKSLPLFFSELPVVIVKLE